MGPADVPGRAGHSRTRRSSRSRTSAFANGAATRNNLAGGDPPLLQPGLERLAAEVVAPRWRNRYASTIDRSGEYTPIV